MLEDRTAEGVRVVPHAAELSLYYGSRSRVFRSRARGTEVLRGGLRGGRWRHGASQPMPVSNAAPPLSLAAGASRRERAQEAAGGHVLLGGCGSRGTTRWVRANGCYSVRVGWGAMVSLVLMQSDVVGAEG